MILTTTEELKNLASSDNTNELMRRLARECLANREAQPVAWGYEWASCITCDGPQNFKHVIEREAPPKWAIDEGQARNVTPLYTAPPATAVVKLPTTRLWAGVIECYSKSDVISAMHIAGVEVSND